MSAPRININNLPPVTRARLEAQLASKSSFFSPSYSSTFSVSSKLDQSKLVKNSTNSDETTADKKKRKPRRKVTLTPDRAKTIIKAVKVSPDGNEVKFILAVNPSEIPTHQQQGAYVGKDGKAHFFTKSHIAKAEKTFVIAFEKYAGLTRKWGRVPYEVEYTYLFGYPSGTPKRDLHEISPMLERPDGSNITKGLSDALTKAGMWIDDSLINNEISKKRRTNKTPCIVIRIQNLQPKFDALYLAEKEASAPSLFSDPNHPAVPSETNPLSDLTKQP